MGLNCMSDDNCGNMKCLKTTGFEIGFCMCPAYVPADVDSYCLYKSDDDVIYYPDCNGWLYYNFFLYSLIQIDFFNWILTSPNW